MNEPTADDSTPDEPRPSGTGPLAARIGVVAIGRNEGERLRACLESARRQVKDVVYVDSGSTDGSVQLARDLGCDVVELDLTQPFTAAPARNAGYARLKQAADVPFVFFTDGDCELVDGFLATALNAMDDATAVVCGRRRERHPDASVYNRLCDLEWDTPVGEAKSCGGDALIRAEAFEQVGGYDGGVIAGEEPEMCVRLRASGWKIRRIAAEMTLHDAAMTTFGQWWKRNVRAGHAYAEGNHRHGGPPERFAAKQVRSNWLWGLTLPLATVMAMGVLLVAWWPLVLAPPVWAGCGYFLLMFRVYQYREARGASSGDAWLYARYTVLGKLPQALGQVKFWRNRASGRQEKIIEYKAAARPSP